MMRWLSQLLVIIIVCFLVIPLLSAPAQAAGAYIRLSPDDGVPGEKVTVRGYNFTAEKWVDIYYYLDTSDSTWKGKDLTDEDGHFEITFEIPESYKGDHKVRAEEDSSSAYVAEATFEVQPGLTVNPEKGHVGTNVTVEGHGFAGDEEGIELRYYLNGKYKTIEENIEAAEDGWWQWSFQIPPSAKGSHKIDAEGDESQGYEVEDVTFEVTPEISLVKSSGSPGESITMMGSGFYADDRYIKILFAGEQTETEPEIIRADENGSWNASFQVPGMPTAEYSVTAEGQYTKDVTGLTYEIEPGLVLSPDEGHVGTNLTVTGGGFAPNKNVVIKYEGSEVGTAETNAEGSFSRVTFPVPESKHGQRPVTAEDDSGNSATANFIMESDPPDTPEPISPPDGGRVGFIGSVTPTFNWSAVSDDSGVYYSLQIATSDNVTRTGEFVDPIVSSWGIVGTNYTLNATDALPHGTYYWIVQAVDGAENESGWTEAHSFRAGLLPRWAFIVIIVAVAAGIGAAVYFFIIRKRIYYY